VHIAAIVEISIFDAHNSIKLLV